MVRMKIKHELIVEVANLQLEDELVPKQDVATIKSWLKNKEWEDLFNYFRFELYDAVD